MRRAVSRFSRGDENSDVNLTPMLDVVFIMLIFFIVTATFIKQAGAEVTRPDAATAQQKPTVSVVVAVTRNGEIWIDNRRVEGDSVRAHIERLHAENPKGGLVVQADRQAKAEALLTVLEAARVAGIPQVAVATER